MSSGRVVILIISFLASLYFLSTTNRALDRVIRLEDGDEPVPAKQYYIGVFQSLILQAQIILGIGVGTFQLFTFRSDKDIVGLIITTILSGVLGGGFLGVVSGAIAALSAKHFRSSVKLLTLGGLALTLWALLICQVFLIEAGW